MSAKTAGEMETMHQAIARLEQRGFTRAFRATRGGALELSNEGSFSPETLVLEETVRFEGASDPEDEAVLFALRSRDGRIKGTFVASYGTQMDPDCAAAIQRLTPARTRHPGHRSHRRGDGGRDPGDDGPPMASTD